MKKAKTLLVDTNRAALTVYSALVARGHEVWVVGGDPTEPLAKIAPHYRQLDYSDTARLSSFIEEEAFDFLVPGCTDVSYRSCSEVSQGRFPGLDNVRATQAIHDKALFRELAGKLCLPVPRVLSVDEAVGQPAVIVKPADAFSGRGISVLADPRREAVSAAVARARHESKTDTALIEEFVEGQLYSHSAFVESGRVRIDFIVREDCTADRFAVDTSRVEFDFPSSVRERLRLDIEALLAGAGLVDGLVHSQFILREEHYWIIEVTRRCPGDLYALLIEAGTGYPYGASYAAPFLGERPAPPSAAHLQERIIRHTVTASCGETFWGFRFLRPTDVRYMFPLSLVGDRNERSACKRLGLLFLGAASKVDEDSLYQSLLDGTLYRLDLDLS